MNLTEITFSEISVQIGIEKYTFGDEISKNRYVEVQRRHTSEKSLDDAQSGLIKRRSGRYFYETKAASGMKIKKIRRKIDVRERERERGERRGEIVRKNIISLSRLTLIGELVVARWRFVHDERIRVAHEALDYCRGNFSSRQFATVRIIQLRKFEVKCTAVKHAWLFAGYARMVASRASSAKNREDT